MVFSLTCWVPDLCCGRIWCSVACLVVSWWGSGWCVLPRVTWLRLRVRAQHSYKGQDALWEDGAAEVGGGVCSSM